MSQNLKFNLNRLQALKNYRYAKATVENGHDSPDAITIADSVDGHSSTENGIDEDSEECHSMDESRYLTYDYMPTKNLNYKL